MAQNRFNNPTFAPEKASRNKDEIFRIFQSMYQQTCLVRDNLARQLLALDLQLHDHVDQAEYQLGPEYGVKIAEVIAANPSELQLEGVRDEWESRARELYNSVTPAKILQHVGLTSELDLEAQQCASGATCFN